MAKYKKCVPSGRKMGHRCEEYRAGFSLVTSEGAPPEALIWDNAAMGEGENTITPLILQLAPRPSCASQRICAVVALSSIVFSLPFAKNPRDRLSGDQKGKMASLVSGRVRASDAFVGRTQIAVFASVPVAVKAT